MPDINDMTPGQILADASVAEFIKSLGLSIAEAQTALDENSVNQIAHFVEPRDALDGKSLLDLGLSPAFYHYQHADLSCSLQLSLRVEESIGVDLNLSGNFGDTSSSSGSSSESSSETSSGSSTRRTTRSARVEIAMTTRGALSVGGTNYQLQGADPMERIAELAQRIRGDSGNGVERVLPTPQQCAPVNPTEVPELADVITTANTVAFTNGNRLAWIRIAEVPTAAETYRMAAGVEVQVEPGANLEAHANAVADAIRARGYDAEVYGSPAAGPVSVFRHRFDIDRYDYPNDYRPEQRRRMRNLALFLRETGITGIVQGYTDRSGPPDYNRELGQRRGEYVRTQLRGHGVPAPQITLVQSTGEQRWADESQPDGVQNEEHRIVEVRLPSNYPYLIAVAGDDTHPIDQAQVAPNQIGDPTGGDNGFVAVYTSSTEALTGRIDIGAHQFPLSGTAVAGHAQDTPESYARNLANAINANEAAGVHASATGNVVHLCPRGAKFELHMVTSSTRNIEMSGTEDVTVTQQFTRTRSRNVTEERTGNRTVAVGASLGLRFQRQFEMSVTGNSSITARLVAVPAPPEFLATIKEYLS